MTQQAEFVLYDAANSPCGRRVRMVMLEKGIDHEIRWLNLGLMDQKQDWYLGLNPNGVVPTLLHQKRVIYDSNVINEYLDRVIAEPPLIPRDVDKQVEMRMWLAFEMEWAKPFRDAIYQTYGKQRLQETGITTGDLIRQIKQRTDTPVYADMATDLLNEPQDMALLAGRIDILYERMSWMNEQLGDGRTWLLGNDFSLADLTLASRLDMFPFIGVNDLYERFPGIQAFMQRACSRPSWQASALLPEKGNSTTQVNAKQPGDCGA